MIKANIEIISKHISEERLIDNIKNIVRFHRIQGSKGYRNSANFIKDRLINIGIECKILEFTADYDVQYLGMKSFKEWNCNSAYCKLVYPNELKLSDYEDNNISIFQKSYSCDYSNSPLDVVLLDKGSDENNYLDIDISGKIIFVRDDYNAYFDWAIRKRGALGIISDYVVENNARTRHDMYKNRKYTTFWWNKEEDTKPFGFVITPEQGDYLAKLCKQLIDSEVHKYPQVSCFVDSEFCNGSFEVVVATIPGEIDEEIWITAHLCHPKESANDNASGVSASMESIRVISELTNQNKLKPLKRTLKIILMPEFTGIYAYLSKLNSFDNVLAAINLDMVGGKQELGYGPLTISGLAYSTPSFVTNLSTYILNEIKKETQGFSSNNMVPMFNTAVCGFTEGSDHFILQDPTISIPTPMLGQWPDMFYHTDGDSIEVISKHIISKSTLLATSYVYTLCTLEENELECILDESILNMTNVLIDSIKIKGIDENSDISRNFEYIKEFYIKSNEHILRFFVGNDNIKSLINKYNNVLETIYKSISNIYHTSKIYDIQESTCSLVPCRKYVTPINNLSEFVGQNIELRKELDEYYDKYRKDHNNFILTEILIQYYINGVYTVDEIANRVLFECYGGSKKAIKEYIFLLYKFKFIEFLGEGN